MQETLHADDRVVQEGRQTGNSHIYIIIYTIILLMDSVCSLICLCRLFVVVTDRVLGRSLYDMS